MDLLNQHRSIRKFKAQEVPEAVLQQILYSGTRASTTGNMQLYSIVVSRDKAQREKLAPLHFNQPVAVNAPVLLTFVADFNRFITWCRQNGAQPGYDNFISFLNACVDASLVAQNVCVAAENLGLGICYLGTTTYNARELIDLLGLPKFTFPLTTVALGYPDEAPDLSDRLPLDGIVHYEGYKNYTADDIDKLYRLKENLESSKQFVAENGKAHLAQVFTDVRYKKTDNEFFSEKCLQVIKEQGFRFPEL